MLSLPRARRRARQLDLSGHAGPARRVVDPPDGTPLYRLAKGETWSVNEQGSSRSRALTHGLEEHPAYVPLPRRPRRRGRSGREAPSRRRFALRTPTPRPRASRRKITVETIAEAEKILGVAHTPAERELLVGTLTQQRVVARLRPKPPLGESDVPATVFQPRRSGAPRTVARVDPPQPSREVAVDEAGLALASIAELGAALRAKRISCVALAKAIPRAAAPSRRDASSASSRSARSARSPRRAAPTTSSPRARTAARCTASRMA